MKEFLVTVTPTTPGSFPKSENVYADVFMVTDGDLIFSEFLEGDGSYENSRAFAKGRWLEVKILSR